MSNKFALRSVPVVGLTGFDTDYIDYDLVDYVEKIGKGENDFVVKTKVVKRKTNIQDLIQSQSCQVGVKNMMKSIGLPAGAVIDPDVVEDYSNAPDNAADMMLLKKDCVSKFKELPSELINGRSLQDFVNSLTQEEFDAWVNSLKHVNDGGDNNE